MSYLDEALCCVICVFKFDEALHLPLALPCGHTFCQECTSSLNKMSCPECNVEFGSAKECKKNFEIIRQIRIIQDATNLKAREAALIYEASGDIGRLCLLGADGGAAAARESKGALCDICNDSPAALYCEACSAMRALCEECCALRHRSPAFATHSRVPWRADMQVIACRYHAGYVCALYCCDDAVPMCQLCSETTHRGHNSRPLADELHAASRRARMVLARLDSMLATTDASLQAMRSAYEKLTGSAQIDSEAVDTAAADGDSETAVMKQISAHFAALREEARRAIDEREQALLQEARVAAASAADRLRAQSEAQALLAAKLQSARSTAEQALQGASKLGLLQFGWSISELMADLTAEASSLSAEVDAGVQVEFSAPPQNTIAALEAALPNAKCTIQCNALLMKRSAEGVGHIVFTVVGPEGAKLRRTVDRSSAEVAVLTRGQVVTADEIRGNRVHVVAPVVGWGSLVSESGFLLLCNPNGLSKMKVVGPDGAKIRLLEDRASAFVAQLERGAVAAVCERRGNRVHIVDPVQGWGSVVAASGDVIFADI